ncbi:MAG: RNase J family beta-CASP ribonuclease [Candidatus Woesearchaeota archaeon]
MTLELMAVGGYSEVGKNMTAIKYNDEVVICDIGYFIPKLIDYEELEGTNKRTSMGLKRIGAVPDDRVLKPWQNKVKAIVSTHAHLDHIGAIPFLADKYNSCPIIATPFTIEVLKGELKNEKIKISNPLKVLNAGSILKISKNIQIEFINSTHSTPQTVIIAIHTPDGTVIYTNDFKLDNNPTLGKKPDYDRMKKIASEKEVVALITDSLYADTEGKTPSEAIAKQMLKDVLLGIDNEKNAIIVTTFASHIARLKSIVELGKRMHRKVVFLGRSLAKYSAAAENIGLVNFTQDVEIAGYSRQIQKKLQQIEKKDRHKYLIVCTGNQAEEGSVLVRLSTGKLHFKFINGDHVIFSCRTIPAEDNILNRAKLETRLKQKKVRIFKDIHVSGHGHREDIVELINLFKPKILIPSHAGHDKAKHTLDIGKDLGYKNNKTMFMLSDGRTLKLK